MKNKIYFAAPLFSEAEKAFNTQLKNILAENFDVYLPQEDGMLIVNLLKQGMSFACASKVVFDADIKAINDADILLIILDGRAVDEGASMELGYAFSKGKRCIGYSTDPRRLLPDGQNPMITGCLEKVVHSIDEFNDYMLCDSEVKVCGLFSFHV